MKKKVEEIKHYCEECKYGEWKSYPLSYEGEPLMKTCPYTAPYDRFSFDVACEHFESEGEEKECINYEMI